MLSRPIPADLLPWALSSLRLPQAEPGPGLVIVAGDASNRRYFRLDPGGSSFIVAEAPPETENNEAFLAVRDCLAGLGVRVPEVLAVDLERGYLLLEDLGDRLLLPVLSADNVDHYYEQARDILLHMVAPPDSAQLLPAYNATLLREELSRFPQWFSQGLLGYTLDDRELAWVEALDQLLIDSALEQPRVLVHRDFHSRNLMLQPDGQLGVIDFQDAVIGPVTYDLVSRLRDCYVRWPAAKVEAWALSHRNALRDLGCLPAVNDTRFLRWMDWMGLQRHIKVLGTFARLYLRDGKAGYLEDLPLVIGYVREILHKYAHAEAAFANFAGWFDSALMPLVEQQSWSTAR